MTDHADPSPIITIERHILDEQAFHPEATGTLTNILYDLALAGKVIASKTTRAGLAEILGRTGDINIQGETVMKLDRFADLTVTRLTDHTGRLAGLASEENAEFLPIPKQYPMGKYLLVFDPLDGSSNVDFNMPVGTIFGIYRRKKDSGPVSLDEFLQPGRNLVASGYIAYGTSTMFVYTAGHGVHGFTLDPSVGEFLLSHPDIRIPKAKYFSVNLGYQMYWSRASSSSRNTCKATAAGSGAVAALHRDARLRLPPQPARGRRLLLPGRHEGPESADGEAAAPLRSQSAGLYRRAGRGLRLGRQRAHPRHQAVLAPPTDAPLHRRQGARRQGRGVHPRPERLIREDGRDMKIPLARTIAVLVLAAAAAATGCAKREAPAPGTAATAPGGGWISLFNGRDLEGWIPKFAGRPLGENYRDTFRVEDGVLRVSYDGYDEFDGEFGHLFYKEPFGRYALRIEYRFVGGQAPGGPAWGFRNSGVMIHSQSPESMGLAQSFPVSIEVQFLGGDGPEERPTANLCTPGTNVVMAGELVTRHCTNSASPTFRGDGWVTVEVEVEGRGPSATSSEAGRSSNTSGLSWIPPTPTAPGSSGRADCSSRRATSPSRPKATPSNSAGSRSSSSGSVQDLADPLRVGLAGLVRRVDDDVGRGRGAELELDGPGDLLLLEDGRLHDGVVRAQVLEDGHPHGVDGHAVRAGQEDAGVLARPGHRPLVDEGLEPVQDDQGRPVGGVDLGDHPPLVGGAVELTHETVPLARYDADGVLERHAEDAAELMRLQAAGRDDALPRWPRDGRRGSRPSSARPGDRT